MNESFKQTNDSVRTTNKTQRKLLYLTEFLSLCALLVSIFKSDTNVINPAPVYILQKPEQTTKDTQLKTPSHTQKGQEVFAAVADEINEQDGTLLVDVYGSFTCRYDVVGVDGKLYYKLLSLINGES